MPRRQPPKGYIRSKEVQAILHISSAMVREYVIKGKIHHLVQPGETHGFYRESDVRKLANELNAYLNFEDGKEHVRLTTAVDKDIPACIEITRALFANSDENAATTPPDRIISWIKKNPQTVYVLREELDNEYKVVGYVFALPLLAGNKIISDILQADLLGEVNVTSSDIEEYKPGRDLLIYIAAVGVHPNIASNKSKFYGSILIGGFIDKIIALGNKGVTIREILAIGSKRQGVRLLQAFGFSEIRPLKPGKRTFSLRIDESGANIAEQYRHAFSDWKEKSPEKAIGKP